MNSDERSRLPPFWRGGLIQLGGAFCAGVLVALMALGTLVSSTALTERRLGQCQAACRARGYQLFQLDRSACMCSRIGAPDRRIGIDPLERADLKR